MTELTKAWRTIECTWWLRIFVATAVGIAMGAFMIWVSGAVTIDHRAPVSIQKVETLNSPVPAGGKLLARIWREKVRDDCPLHSERYASDEQGRAHNLPDAQGIGGAVGDDYVDIIYDTSSLPPGSYVLHVSVMYHCPGQSFPVQQQPVAFTVTD